MVRKTVDDLGSDSANGVADENERIRGAVPTVSVVALVRKTGRWTGRRSIRLLASADGVTGFCTSSSWKGFGGTLRGGTLDEPLQPQPFDLEPKEGRPALDLPLPPQLVQANADDR